MDWPRYSIITLILLHLDTAGLSRLCHQGVLLGTGHPWISQNLNGKRWRKVKVSNQPNFSFISFIGILLLQEEVKNGEISLKDYNEGQVQQLKMEEVGNPISIKHFLFWFSQVGAPGGGKETYGTWDQSLNLLPAMSRSTEPRPKQWILLAKSRCFWYFWTTQKRLSLFRTENGWRLYLAATIFFFLVQKIGWG